MTGKAGVAKCVRNRLFVGLIAGALLSAGMLLTAPPAPAQAAYDHSQLAGGVGDAARHALAAVKTAESAAQKARNGASGYQVISFGEGRSYAGKVDSSGGLEGYGVLTWPNGDRHAGLYAKGVRSGDGAFFFGDGRRYLGEWRNDMYDGLGVLFRADGSIESYGRWSANNYVGPEKKYDLAGLSPKVRSAAVAARNAVLKAEEAARRARDGKAGTRVTSMEPEGRYEGEVDANGTLHGYGVLTWPNGDRHAGHYENGVRSGYGAFYFYEGRRYEGQWTADKYGGWGVLFNTDGSVEDSGRWSENARVSEPGQ